MDKKLELIKLIDKKELELQRATRESKVWNKSKYKNSSNASISKLYVESLRNEIHKLQKQLEEL